MAGEDPATPLQPRAKQVAVGLSYTRLCVHVRETTFTILEQLRVVDHHVLHCLAIEGATKRRELIIMFRELPANFFAMTNLAYLVSHFPVSARTVLLVLVAEEVIFYYTFTLTWTFMRLVQYYARLFIKFV